MRRLLAVLLLAVAVITAGCQTSPAPTVANHDAGLDKYLNSTDNARVEVVSEYVTSAACSSNGRAVVASWGELSYRDNLADNSVNVAIGSSDLPLPPGIQAGDLRGDPALRRMKDGTLIYERAAFSHTHFSPTPEWASWNNWGRAVLLMWTSTCGDKWTLLPALDTKDVSSECAYPQAGYKKDGSLDAVWFGGWDRPELYVDPFNGTVYVSSLCRGGFAWGADTTAFPWAQHRFEHTLILALSPGGASWKTVADGPFYQAPVAMTSLPDGRLVTLHCPFGGGTPSITTFDITATLATDLTFDLVDPSLKFPCVKFPDADGGGHSNTFDLRVVRAGTTHVRVAIPDAGGQVHIDLLDVTLPPTSSNTAPTLTPVMTVTPGEHGHINHFDFIEADATGVGKDGGNDAALLYWTEYRTDTHTSSERYLVVHGISDYGKAATISAAGWGDAVDRSDPAKPVYPWIGDYDDGGYARSDGVCHFLLAWSEAGAVHEAVVDDPCGTGNPPATPTPAPTATPTATPTVASTSSSSATATAASPTATSLPKTTPTPKPTPAPTPTPVPWSVTSATLSFTNPCTDSGSGTYGCVYHAAFTLSNAQGGTFSWGFSASENECGGGSAPVLFGRGPYTVTVPAGQTSVAFAGTFNANAQPDLMTNPSSAFITVAAYNVTSPPASYWSGACKP